VDRGLSGFGPARTVCKTLVLDHFGFQDVSGRVGSGIKSSSVGSFRVSDRIWSDIEFSVSNYFRF
jgi:hypothetical protein